MADILRKAPAFGNLAKNFGVNVANVVEAIRQPLYDTLPYAAAGQTSLTFFSTPIGQGGKTKVSTNLTNAGMLPAPQNFLCTAIHLMFKPGASLTPASQAASLEGASIVEDTYVFGTNGLLEVQVGSKIQLQDGPLGLFPPATLMELNLATTVAANSQGYGQWKGLVYDITPILIPWGQNFNVTLNWDALVPLPSTVAGTVQCRLDGYLYRLAQ